MQSPAVKTTDHTLELTRVFNAPRERVFDAWLDPDQMAQWKGPRTVRAHVLQHEARPGGRYRIHMKGIESGDGPTVGGIYREIKRPERLVFTWVWETPHPRGVAGQETLVTLTFRDVGGKTEMTLRHDFFETKETRDGHQDGWTASFDRLDELLER